MCIRTVMHTYLAHPGGRHGAEGPDEVGLDAWGRLVGEDTGASQQVNWNLKIEKQKHRN